MRRWAITDDTEEGDYVPRGRIGYEDNDCYPPFAHWQGTTMLTLAEHLVMAHNAEASS